MIANVIRQETKISGRNMEEEQPKILVIFRLQGDALVC